MTARSLYFSKLVQLHKNYLLTYLLTYLITVCYKQVRAKRDEKKTLN